MIADILQTSNDIHAIYAIVADVFIITLVIIAIVFVARVLLNSSYTIQQINVPASFEAAGHTGPVIARRIQSRLNEIIQHVSAAEYAKGYNTSAADSDVSVDVAGMGMPIKGFIELIGNTFGIRRHKKIDADIFIDGEHVVMTLQITGKSPERFEVAASENLGAPIRELVREAAESILKYSDDEALQVYFGHIVRNGEKAAKLARYRLERYKDNKFMEARMVSALARGLCLMKKYDEAEEKLRLGIALNPNEGRLYNVWGMMLQEQGKHEQATAKLSKAFTLMNAKETKFRRSNVLTAVGVSLSKLGRSDAAIKYFEQAIGVDENAHLSYYNLAKEHLLKKNVESFYEVLEKSFAKGLTPNHVRQDKDLQHLLAEVRLQHLMEKFPEG
jgi:tetratricopeptide (TPR) repeat protein